LSSQFLAAAAAAAVEDEDDDARLNFDSLHLTTIKSNAVIPVKTIRLNYANRLAVQKRELAGRQGCRSSLLSGQNVRWPCRMLPPGESR